LIPLQVLCSRPSSLSSGFGRIILSQPQTTRVAPEPLLRPNSKYTLTDDVMMINNGTVVSPPLSPRPGSGSGSGSGAGPRPTSPFEAAVASGNYQKLPVKVLVVHFQGQTESFVVSKDTPADEIIELLQSVFPGLDSRHGSPQLALDPQSLIAYDVGEFLSHPAMGTSGVTDVYLLQSHVQSRPQSPLVPDPAHLIDVRFSDDEAEALEMLLSRAGPGVHAAFQSFPQLEHIAQLIVRLVVPRDESDKFDSLDGYNSSDHKHSSGPMLSPTKARFRAPEDSPYHRDELHVPSAPSAPSPLPSDVNPPPYRDAVGPSAPPEHHDDPTADAATREVSSIIAQLVHSGALSEEDATMALFMLREKHPLVMASLVAYNVNQDEADLVDSITRIIARIKAAHDEQVGTGSPRSPITSGGSARIASIEDAKAMAANPLSLLLRVCHEQGLFSDKQFAELLSLNQIGHPVLDAACDAYVSELHARARQPEATASSGSSEDAISSMREFVDTCLRLLVQQRSKKRSATTAAANDDDVGDEAVEAIDEHDAAAEFNVRAASMDEVAAILMQIARDPRFEHQHIAQLVQLVKSHNPTVLASIDVFLRDQDWDDLTNTLLHIVGIVSQFDSEQAHVAADDKNEDSDDNEDGDNGDDSPARRRRKSSLMPDETDLDAVDTSQLLSMVGILRADGTLTAHQSQALRVLIEDRDPTLLDVFVKFSHERNYAVFTAAISARAREAAGDTDISSGAAHSPSQSAGLLFRTASSTSVGDPHESDAAAAAAAAASPREYTSRDIARAVEMVDFLHAQEKISSTISDAAHIALEAKNSTLLQAFDQFHKDNDWPELFSALATAAVATVSSDGNDDGGTADDVGDTKQFDLAPHQDRFASVLDSLVKNETITANVCKQCLQMFEDQHKLVVELCQQYEQQPDDTQFRENMEVLIDTISAVDDDGTDE
jgi:hypothetical protein